MAVTRINNNQITDASGSNIYLGIDASTKLQNYSITAGKLANNITYGSNWTISGNLTVQGTTTTVDTVNTLIQDPLLVLADGQVSGSPSVDIGIIGYRGSSLSSFIGWKESAGEFVTALSNTTVSNTTANITQYANLHASSFIANSTITAVGNIQGNNLIAVSNLTTGNSYTSGFANVGGNLQVAGFTTLNGNTNINGNLNVNGNITYINVVDLSVNDPLITLAANNVTNSYDIGFIGQYSLGSGNLYTGWARDHTDGTYKLFANLATFPENVVDFANSTPANAQFGNISVLGNISATGNLIINGNTQVTSNFNVGAGNVFYVNTGTNTASFGSNTQTTGALVAFNTATSILMPVGNTGQRPGSGTTGMLRFNTTNNSVEVYDNSGWSSVGVSTFTVIADQQFNGDNSTLTFTLSSTQTTNSCIVSINGVVQIPTVAYSVSGTYPTCVLTFTEAPEAGDLIDVRQLTTTQSITSIANSPGNAAIAVLPTSNVVTVTGALVPVVSNAQSLGNSTNWWKSLYISGNTIYMGGTALSLANGNLSVGTNQVVTANASGTTVASGNISVTGSVSAGTTISATGNVYTGNVINAGLSSAAGNVTGGNLITGGLISATGNVYSGNLINAGSSSVTGNITGGNVIFGSGVVSGSGNIYGNRITGTLVTSAQPNITSLGTLTSLAVSGNITPGGIAMSTGNATIGNLYVSGNTTIAGNITQVSGNSGQFFGNASTGFNALYAGLPAGFNLLPQSVVNFVAQYPGYSQINNQNQSAANVATTDWVLTANNGDDNTYYVDMGIASSTYNGAVAILNNALGNACTPQDGYLYVTGNVAAGNPSDFVIGTLDAGGQIRFIVAGSNQANVSVRMNAPNNAAANATSGTMVVTGGIGSSSTVFATGNITGGNILTAGQVSAGGNITGANLSVGTGTITVNNIVNGGSNATGNIGSSSTYFNTIFAKATSAQYADLAEKYTADAEYAPGTVISFGGDKEVTISTADADRRVAGVVSTNPSYIMNAGLEDEFVATVALTGRVPCNVTGSVRKGDLMVSAGNGQARADADPRVGTVIGKALEDFDGNSGTIEVVVGRF